MHKNLLLSFYLLLCSNVFAQEYISHVTHYDQDDGLSHNQVKWILKDQQGIMWMGAVNGINRFDGHEFKFVSEMNFFHAANSNVFEDNENDLWLEETNPNSTLTFFNTKSEKRKTFQEKFGSDTPFDETQYKGGIKMPDGSIVLGTTDGRLLKYRQGYGFSLMLEFDEGEINPCGFTSDDEVWIMITSKKGIRDVENCQFILLSKEGKIQQRIGLEEYHVFADVDNAGGLFVFNKKGVLKELTRSGEVVNVKSSAQKFLGSRCFKYDAVNKRQWMAREGDLAVYNEKTNKLSNLSEEHKELKVYTYNYSILENDGAFWLGSIEGVFKIQFSLNPFQQVLSGNPKKDFPKDFISCRGLTSDHSGNFYINAKGKTFKVNSSRQVSIIDSLGARIDLYFDGNKYLWTGGLANISRINIFTQEKKTYTISGVKDNIYVWNFFEDKEGRLWIASEIGFFYIDKNSEEISVFNQFNGFESQWFNEMYDAYPDKDSKTWLATTSGLFLLDTKLGIVDRYWKGGDSLHYLPSNNLRHIYQDTAGIFWIASADGLIRWDKKKNKSQLFTIKNGLSHNHIYAVYEDDFGFLWLSSDNGIMQFEKKSYKIRKYLPHDGISHREFNRISHHQTDDGTIYFGGLNGVTYFHPKYFYKDFYAQPDIPLVLTKYQVFSGAENKLKDKTLSYKRNQKIVMTSEDRYLNLQFALLDYSASNAIQYAYQIALDGKLSKEDWNYGKENSIKIGTLPFGSHRLVVKGRTANGLFSKSKLIIPIEVVKPFYLQWWAIGLGIFSLLLLGFLIAKARTKILLRRHKELETIVAERTQTILAQADKLKELDKAKTQFLTSISHEFRTPLTLILNSLEENEGADLLHPALTFKQQLFYKKDVEIMRRNANRLQNLIDQLLDLSKLEAGKMKLKTEPGDFYKYLNSLVLSFQSLAKKKNIQLRFNSPVKEIEMYFDRDKMDKVFYNLLSNAIKFTPQGGKVSVDLETTSNKLNVKVKDTGRGIEPKDLNRIFDRFYQAQKVDAFSQGGTGIGLALVKELIKVHYGEVRVESQLNAGTCFTISLPLGRSHLKATEIVSASDKKSEFTLSINETTIPEDATLSKLENQKVSKPLLLVIEDNEDLRYYQQKRFGKEYRLLSAVNGIEGIKIAIENIPDLIICDIMMPGKNGYEVCETLKNDERTNHIPIVLLTAKAASTSKLKGLGIGADDYITKPYDHRELSLRLRNLLEQRRRLQKKFKSNLLREDRQLADDTPKDPFVVKIMEIIDANYSDPKFTVEELSQMVRLSRSQLFRKLKALTGETSTNLIRSYRIRKAKQLLEKMEYNATEVSYMVGFSNPSYFFKCFKNEFGMTPKELLAQPKTL